MIKFLLFENHIAIRYKDKWHKDNWIHPRADLSECYVSINKYLWGTVLAANNRHQEKTQPKNTNAPTNYFATSAE